MGLLALAGPVAGVLVLLASATTLYAQKTAAESQSQVPAPNQAGSQVTQPNSPPAQGQSLNIAKPSPSFVGPPTPQAAVAEPPKPDWPANNKPEPAKITFDSHGLTVDANNSSLDEILKEVSTQTGAKLEGKVGDERIFGSYGPGSARDVVTQLLDGLTYNVMMIGDQGEGTPRQIVLTNRPTGPAPANNGQNNNAEDESEYEQPQQPMPGVPGVRAPFGAPGMPPEQNQQQMEQRREEMEQRQEQFRQQQEQQQQQQQQPQQPPQQQ